MNFFKCRFVVPVFSAHPVVLMHNVVCLLNVITDSGGYNRSIETSFRYPVKLSSGCKNIAV